MLQGREISDTYSQLDALDGLRGLAVLLVFLSHTSLREDHLIPMLNFAGVGKSGVFLFFVLSSFLLTRPFLVKGRDGLDFQFLKTYTLRRFLRIYPLYIAYLSVALLITVLLPTLAEGRVLAYPFPLEWSGYLGHLTLFEGKGVTWSVPVEFSYYFVLPVLALTYSVALKNRLIPCTVLTLALVAGVQLLWPQSESALNGIGLPPYLPIFFLGAYIAVVHHHLSQQSADRLVFMPKIIEAIGLSALLILILMIPAITRFFMGENISNGFFHRQFIAYGVLWSLVLLASVNGIGWLQRFFEIPALRYIGFISFSAYLLHAPIIDLVYAIDLPRLIYPWVILLLTAGCSHCTWTLIEKRMTYRRPVSSQQPVEAAKER